MTAGGASPRIGYRIEGAPAGRKIYVRTLFLSPLQGSTLHSDPTPGLRPGLFSFRPSRACRNGRVNDTMETSLIGS